MRLLQPLLLSLSVLSSLAAESDTSREKHDYQSDVARMRKIVINSLYSHKDIFLRELISNANDALEKLRLTSLTDKSLLEAGDILNITIQSSGTNDDDLGPRVIITDSGIGMTPDELTKNLGTLAKSGTSDFLARAENSEDGVNTGNLIGAFGLGFYSSFLVADTVHVASIPPKTEKNPNPEQYVFSSSADDSTFETYPDPRGNTLGRGTEITLFLRPDSLEYLDTQKLSQLVNKHSSYSSTFPIWLLTKKTKEVPEEKEVATDETAEPSVTPSTESHDDVDDEDAIAVEDEPEEEEEIAEPPRMRTVEYEDWVKLNPAAPLWQRDKEDIKPAEYTMFYKGFFKDFSSDPIAWTHFSGDSGSGVSFKGLLFLPGTLPDSYWQQPLEFKSNDIKILNKRVFITDDLGQDALPKWASWVKVVIDAEDLPLNVSRETLQSTRFFRQLKQIILKRLIQLLTRMAEDEPEKFQRLQESYGSIMKLGAVEDTKNRDKLAALARFHTNQRNNTSLDEYLENKKQGQKQIFYLAEMGKNPDDLSKSVFVEKLNARGYEVLLLNEPLDEIFVQNLRRWKNIAFQDIAKVGLKFGDEDMDPEEEKKEHRQLTERFKPLLEYLKKEAEHVVRDVVISNRLVTSACAIVADSHGYTANVQRMMRASNQKENPYLNEFSMKAKLLEINPRSPLIEGLLRRVEQLPTEEDDERDTEAEDELKEVLSILIDGALVRSGFEVPDSNNFFTRVDRVLRRSLGVSETAPTDTTVKPAPPVDPELPLEPELDFPEEPGVHLPDYMKDQVSIELEEIDENGNPVVAHDEL